MDLHPKQFVRVSVTAARNNGRERVLERTFSVDPRTITLDRLRHLIARAMDIRDEFSILVLRNGGKGHLPLTCDWDLEGALSEESNMDLLLDLQPKEPGFEEWDIISPADVPVAGHEASVMSRNRSGTFLEQILVHLKTPLTSYTPLTELEFENLADWPCPLRYAVYRAEGAQESLRPSLWMHLLDVYPADTGENVRQEFLNKKAEEYYRLRYSWQRLVQTGTIPQILHDVTCLIRKDVKRTDRIQGIDEHALYNVLTTYAMHHPTIGYCQGMSDILSPLLHVMKTEPRAYLAFCGLMQRMQDNFQHDGRSVCIKFRHLRRAIRTHDPELHEHLRAVGALDLIFCYRWILLDLKREFPYEEMMRLQEVLWSTLRPIVHDKGVELYEELFPSPSICDSLKEKDVDPKNMLNFTDNHFGTPTYKGTKDTLTSLRRWAIMSRRQSIAQNIEFEESSSAEDEDGGIIHYNRTKKRRKSHNVCKSWSGRGASQNQQSCFYSITVHEIKIDNWIQESLTTRRRHGSSDSNYESNLSEEEPSEDESPSRGRSEGYTSGQESHQFDEDDSSLNSFDSADTYFNEKRKHSLLPSPTRLGDGKPFLIFLCLTMILNHRDAILEHKMDGNEIGMYFDRLVRKHRLTDVLPKAKDLFAEYLRSGWTDDE